MMGESQGAGSKPFDPIESFRGMRDIYLDAMAKAMVETVNTESYAQASGAILDNTLTMSAPFREGIEKSMLQVLQQLSLPSRQDLLGLAERFTNLEMRLDDMDAKLDSILKLSQRAEVRAAESKAAAESTPKAESKPKAEPATKAEAVVEAKPPAQAPPVANAQQAPISKTVAPAEPIALAKPVKTESVEKVVAKSAAPAPANRPVAAKKVTHGKPAARKGTK